MRTANVVAVAFVIGGLSNGAQACNARGEFCEHPGWAANAFASSDDRVPDYWPEYATNDVTFGYVAPSSGSIANAAYGYVGTTYGLQTRAAVRTRIWLCLRPSLQLFRAGARIGGGQPTWA